MHGFVGGHLAHVMMCCLPLTVVYQHFMLWDLSCLAVYIQAATPSLRTPQPPRVWLGGRKQRSRSAKHFSVQKSTCLCVSWRFVCRHASSGQPALHVCVMLNLVILSSGDVLIV